MISKKYENLMSINFPAKINYIKDNLQNILDGKFDDKFDKEQLKIYP